MSQPSPKVLSSRAEYGPNGDAVTDLIALAWHCSSSSACTAYHKVYIATPDMGLVCYEAVPYDDLDGELHWNNEDVAGNVVDVRVGNGSSGSLVQYKHQSVHHGQAPKQRGGPTGSSLLRC